MFPSSQKLRYGALALGGGLVVTWCLAAQPEVAEPDRSAKYNAATAARDHKYEGDLACRLCHDISSKDADLKADMVMVDVLKRVNMNESEIWSKKDKHRHAYDALTGKRGKEMSELLHFKCESDLRCLSCHTGRCGPEPDCGVAKNKPSARPTLPAAETFGEGVSCEACHGPASDWKDRHSKPDWRNRSAEEKCAYGMRNVRSPVERAELCLSCHLGDPEHGKFITHEMYAAGHPPLPSFEIETFDAAMPSHAKRMSEKPPELQKQLGFDPSDFSTTRAILLSGVISARASVKVLAEEARRASQPAADGAAAEASPVWPELALFDCAACHHQLRLPSWRQSRGYAAAPGRPLFRAWPLVLYKFVDGQGLKTLQPLQAAAQRQPFGKPAELVTAAEPVLKTLDKQAAEQQSRVVDKPLATKLLRGICRLGQRETPDYDTARQLAWSAIAILHELDEHAHSGQALSAPSGAARDRSIREVTAELDRQLHLEFNPEPTAALRNLDASLEAASDYDPQKFQAQLQKLAGLIERED